MRDTTANTDTISPIARDRKRYVLPLYDFLMALPSARAREDFAKRCGVSLGRLRNVTYGLSPSNPKLSVLIERHTDGKVTRVHLHPDDWREIWPESKVVSRAAAKRSTAAESV